VSKALSSVLLHISIKILTARECTYSYSKYSIPTTSAYINFLRKEYNNEMAPTTQVKAGAPADKYHIRAELQKPKKPVAIWPFNTRKEIGSGTQSDNDQEQKRNENNNKGKKKDNKGKKK